MPVVKRSRQYRWLEVSEGELNNYTPYSCNPWGDNGEPKYFKLQQAVVDIDYGSVEWEDVDVL